MAEIAPRLLVLSDFARFGADASLERFAKLAELAEPGSVVFTLRDYQLAVSERLVLAGRLATLARRAGQTFGLAERADLARATDARALHLPGSGLAARDARAFLGPHVFLSRGGHDPQAEAEPELDALLLSPIFAPRKGRPALGLAALARAAGAAHAPALFALGGVEADTAAACLEAGAAGVAVIGAALRPDPEPLLRALGVVRARG